MFLMLGKGLVNKIPFGLFSSRDVFLKIPSLRIYDKDKISYIKNIIKIVDVENSKGLDVFLSNLFLRKIPLKKLASELDSDISEIIENYKGNEETFNVLRKKLDVVTNDFVISNSSLADLKENLTEINDLIDKLDQLELTFNQS